VASRHSINDLLERAGELLNQAAIEIRDAPLQPTSKNIRHIAEALSEIFEIQHQLHALHPELAPGYMNEPSKDPAKALAGALERARLFEAEGVPETAVAFLKQFLARESAATAEQQSIAEREIGRIEGRDA
jgi:hypothetical protein